MSIHRKREPTIFEAITDGIYIVNQDFVIEYMNPAMKSFFGEGVGRKCYEVIHASAAICSACKAQETFQGESSHVEVYIAPINKYFDIISLSLKNADDSFSKLSIYRDVTQRKKSAERLKTSEQNYQRLFENVGCGVYISSKEGKFLDANPAFLNMFGYSDKEEFLNLDIRNEFYLNPEDRTRFQQIIEKDGKVIEYETRFKTKTGKALTCLLTSQVRYDSDGQVLGYEGIIVDQTHRITMEREIREKNDFINKIINNSPNAIMAVDMNGKIFIFNRAAEESLGYKKEDVIDKMDIREIYPGGMAREVMKALRSPDNGRAGRLKFFPILFKRKDGLRVEGNLSAAIVYDENQQEIAIVGIFVDLKEKMEMESRLKQAEAQLLQAEKLAAMGRLTSQIAHELNNPLFGIMNTLELLKTEVPPDNKRRKILEMALSEIARLSELLRKMLSFSKPDQAEKQPIDLNTVIDEILLLYQKQLRENGIRLTFTPMQRLPLVFASKNQLRQVFINLIVNAMHAMSSGGILTIETVLQANQVAAKITDSGIGIAKEHLDKIFDAFFTTKKSVKGVGLGLSVCYGFISEHGGTIDVVSEPHVGTTFTVLLPVHGEDSKKALDRREAD